MGFVVCGSFVSAGCLILAGCVFGLLFRFIVLFVGCVGGWLCSVVLCFMLVVRCKFVVNSVVMFVGVFRYLVWIGGFDCAVA